MVARVLVDSGADVNAKTEEGWTPLHEAAAVNPAPDAMIALLLELGADPDSRTNDGLTPCQLAQAAEREAATLALLCP